MAYFSLKNSFSCKKYVPTQHNRVDFAVKGDEKIGGTFIQQKFLLKMKMGLTSFFAKWGPPRDPCEPKILYFPPKFHLLKYFSG